MSNLEKPNEKQNKGLGRGLGSLFGAELSKIEFNESKTTQTSEIVDKKEVITEKQIDKSASAPIATPKSKANNQVVSQSMNSQSVNTQPLNTQSVSSQSAQEASKLSSQIESVVLKEEPKVIVKEVIKEVIKEVVQEIPEETRIWSLPIEKLKINNFQPRKNFEKEKIQELANSIKEQGILQPIVARKSIKGDFEIIAGERRWRAAQLAGLHEVPVILKDIDDQKSLELALIENIQRENLNAIEEAEAYERLSREFHLTQQEISLKVGKDRTTITNCLRLLSLAPEVKNMVISGELSTGHAKALLAITDPIKQREVAKKISSEKLTVRAAEKLAKAATKTKEDGQKADEVTNQLIDMMAEDLQKLISTKVKIDYSQGSGKLSIYFYSDSELTQITERLKKSWNQQKEATSN